MTLKSKLARFAASLLLFVAPLAAELVTVSGTVKYADGTAAAGTLHIRWSTFEDSNGEIIASSYKDVTIGSGGAVSVQLWSNADSYTVYFNVTPRWKRHVEYWIVPSGSPTANIKDIRTASSYADPATVLLSQLKTASQATGDLAYFNGTAWSRLGIDIDGQVLTVVSGIPAWGAAAGGVTDHALLTNLDYASAGHTGFQPTITAGTTAQYWRGDKSWQTLNSAAVGLGNVENTALSTWAGTTNITTLGTITTGTFPWASLSGVPSTFAPSAHATSHQNGGADEIATATAGVNAIPKAGAAGTLAAGWIPALSTLSGAVTDAQVPDTITVSNYQLLTGKDAAAGYAGLSASTKLAPAQGQEVWGVSDLTDFASKSGSGTAAIGSTVTTPADNEILGYLGGNWINRTLVEAGVQAALGFTAENSANKDAANGYAGLTASTKINIAQGQEVWGIVDLTGISTVSGSGTAAILSTITTPASNQYLGWTGTNWINRQANFTELAGAATDAQVPDTITVTLAATATALAANGANCPAGQAPLGVDASGVSEGCWTPTGSGDVVGPASSVDGDATAFSGTTGKLLKVATGCSWSISTGGKGYLNCDGGFSAGDGTYAGGIITTETTANGGTFQFAAFGPDAQSADRCWVYPDAQPADNQILKGTAATATVAQDGKSWTGCRVMAWEADAGSSGSVTDDTVLVGNGTVGVEATIPACANATTSKLLYDQATNAFSCGADQTSAAVDCTDPANSCLSEDFYSGPTGASAIGKLGWRTTASTFAYLAGEDGAPGIARIGTTAVLDNVGALTLNQASSNEPLLAVNTKIFTLQMRFRASRTTDIGVHVGIKDDVAFGVNGYGFFLDFDTAVPDSTYQYKVCNSSTCASADSLVALSALWRRVKITNDGAGVVTFSLYGEVGALIAGSTKTFCTAASGCDVNSVVFPTGVTMLHTFTVVNRGATTAATLDADYFSFQMTGLSR